MKPILLFLGVFFGAGAMVAIEPAKGDIVLLSGKVFHEAKIVTISDTDVGILHSGNLTSVPIDDVPLEPLARAKIEIEKKQAAMRQKAGEIAASQAKKEEARKAEPLAKAIATQPMQQLSPLRSEQRLIDLKQQFPASVTRKSGKIEVQVPSVDMWNSYRGMVTVSTIENVQDVAAKLELKAATDLEELKKKAKTAIGSERTQAEWTIEWINGSLRPYLAKLHSQR